MKGEILDLKKIEKHCETALIFFTMALICSFFITLIIENLMILIFSSIITGVFYIDYRYYCTKYYMFKYFEHRR